MGILTEKIHVDFSFVVSKMFLKNKSKHSINTNYFINYFVIDLKLLKNI